MSAWVSHVEQRALGADHVLVTVHLTEAGAGAGLTGNLAGTRISLVQSSEYPPNICGISDDEYADAGFDVPDGHRAMMRDIEHDKITILFERTLDADDFGE